MAQAATNKTAKPDAVTPLMAILAGTPVLTLEGEMPVEYLAPGDRILTRVGARRLVQVERKLHAVECSQRQTE